MSFQATPLNVTALLLVSLAMCSIFLLAKRRFESNLPILFYISLAAYINFTGRGMDSYLLGGGLASALVLRFEFMNGVFTTLVLWLEMLAVTVIAGKLAAGALGLTF